MTSKQQTENIYRFKDKWFRIIGIPIVALLLPLVFFGNEITQDLGHFWRSYLHGIFYSLLYWEGSRWVVGKFRRRMPDLKQSFRRNLWQLLGVTIYGALVTFIVGGTLSALNISDYSQGPNPFRILVAALFATYLITIIYEAIYFFRLWEQAIVEKERFQREAAQAQYAGLKAQLNPHFLFNSLNVLAYTIPEAPDRAVNMVHELAKTYRYVLESEQRETVPLKEELQFLSAYSALLKERFGENFQLQIDLPASWEQNHVLPLSLQMLVENAVKHNVVSSQHPLQVKITSGDSDIIRVSNRIEPRHDPDHSAGIGLDNIRRRYAFYSDTPIRILNDGAFFTVELPVLKIA